MAGKLLLASEGGRDSAHIVSEPGSTMAALCGAKPALVWTRVWSADVARAEVIPACDRCRRLVEVDGST